MPSLAMAPKMLVGILQRVFQIQVIMPNFGNSTRDVLTSLRSISGNKAIMNCDTLGVRLAKGGQLA